MEEASPESPPLHFARPPLPTAARYPMRDYEEEQSMPNVGEGSLRMETSSASKNLRSQKSEQVRRARTTTQAAKKTFKSRKRKMLVIPVEDEAISPTSNRHVQSLSRKMAVATTSRRVISKKVVDRAVSISQAVARKRNEQAMNTQDATLNPENVDTLSSSPPAEASPIAKKIRRSRPATSEVWDHFHEPNENDDDAITVCIHCGKEYTFRAGHGTSNLWKHLRFQCPMAPLKYQNMRKKDNGTPKQCYNYDDCRRALVEMIIIDEMTFRAVEGEGFIKYSNTLQPKFEVPSRTTVARDAMQIFIQEKEKMKMILKRQRVSLTTDTWTSNQNLNYMVLTAHWIDERWQLQRRVINFCLVDDHKGETIGRKIEECLLEWGVDRIFTITVDNASSNNGAINYIKDLSKAWEGTVLQHEFIHMRCCAHIVNLIVRSGLEVTCNSVDKIRTAVKFVRSSPTRLDHFKKCAEKEKISRKRLLSLDVDTRWNSTYIMLDNAVIYERAFARLNKENKQFKTHFEGHIPPTEIDWCNARRVIQFLKIFHKVTVRLSGSVHVTSSGFSHEFVLMQSKLQELSKHSDPIMAAMAQRMKTKFSKYWEEKEDLNCLLFIALILDPRYKVKYLSFFFLGIYGPEKKKELVEKIESDLRRLFDWYVESAACVSLNSNYNQPPLLTDVDEHEENPSMLLASQFSMHLEEVESRETNSELSRYLTENCEKITDDFDLLMWWRYNSSRYSCPRRYSCFHMEEIEAYEEIHGGN